MKIISYNVNGIRAAMKKGLVDWIADHQFDIVCLQEVKAQRGSVPSLLLDSIGCQSCWHSAQKKG